jgi:hypothetical protein
MQTFVTKRNDVIEYESDESYEISFPAPAVPAFNIKLSYVNLAWLVVVICLSRVHVQARRHHKWLRCADLTIALNP